MCFRITPPFFVSTSPLSPECLGRDLVCSISSLSSSSALRQNTFQHGYQPCFGNLRDCGDDLPLSHFIYSVDVINTLDTVEIALMLGPTIRVFSLRRQGWLSLRQPDRGRLRDLARHLHKNHLHKKR